MWYFSYRWCVVGISHLLAFYICQRLPCNVLLLFITHLLYCLYLLDLSFTTLYASLYCTSALLLLFAALPQYCSSLLYLFITAPPYYTSAFLLLLTAPLFQYSSLLLPFCITTLFSQCKCMHRLRFTVRLNQLIAVVINTNKRTPKMRACM